MNYTESYSLKNEPEKIPDIVHETILSTLDTIKNKDEAKVYHFPKKRIAAIVAVACLSIGITAFAIYIPWKERMETLSKEEVDEMFVTAQTVDSLSRTNRLWSKEEKERYNSLWQSYENEGVYPENDIIVVANAEQGKTDKLYFDMDTSTFFFPDRELTDEEILEIIEYQHKADYSLDKVWTGVLENGEEIPEFSKQESVGIDSTEYEKINEKVSFYSMDTGMEGAVGIAANGNYIFVASKEEIVRIPHYSEEKEVVYTPDDGWEVFAVTCNEDNLYASLWKKSAFGEYESKLIRIDSSQNEAVYDTKADSRLDGMVFYNLYADKEGNLYFTDRLNVWTPNYFRYSEDMESLTKIDLEGYTSVNYEPMYMAEDGFIYRIDEEKMLKIDSERGGVVDAVSFMGANPIVPYLITEYSNELLIAGRFGVASYEYGKDNYEMLVFPYETEGFFDEGCKFAAASDNVITILKSDGYVVYLRVE